MLGCFDWQPYCNRLVDIDAGDGNVRIGSIVASNAVEIDSARGAILDNRMML